MDANSCFSSVAVDCSSEQLLCAPVELIVELRKKKEKIEKTPKTANKKKNDDGY